MTHEDAGSYSKKHSEGTQVDEKIISRIRERMSDGSISCAAAHSIAAGLGITPAEVGIGIDLLECRIGNCQLGLFGHSPSKRIVTPADSVAPALQSAIEGALANNRLACTEAWSIAAQFGISRMEIAAACESLAIKISSCQLGAFR
jgi:hypothetical protein